MSQAHTGRDGPQDEVHTASPNDPEAADDGPGLEVLAAAARERRDRSQEFGTASADADPNESSAGRSPRARAPAEGERSAVVGYLGQYEFAAIRSLVALRENLLEGVRLADVTAGQIDDFQLISPERVDAHQIKWSRHPGSIGYAEFVNDASGRTRYIKQLAAGWERLRSLHHPRPVSVHFVTNDLPSVGTSRTLPRPADPSEHVGTWSFAAFLAEAWRPAVEASRSGQELDLAVPEPWRPAMDKLREASGLDPERWSHFLTDCELAFGAPDLEQRVASTPVPEAERAALQRDANSLAHAFMRLVARPDRRVEFTRLELLDELGWRYRTEFIHSHEFPDPAIPYRSIAETFGELARALDQFTGGYIALVGSPGSGKSTLATRALRETHHRVVRYYAYVQGASGGSMRRGEAVNFLHDLTVALDRSGLRPGAVLPIDDLDMLKRRVDEQFSRAKDEWLAEGRRTLVLVDGLDHIPREQHPTHSLLGFLPPPEEVPDGVLFILGTQTDRLVGLSARIREQLNESGRRITMGRLEPGDVQEIVAATEVLDPAPSSAERRRVFDLSGGHPLALNYIINRLRNAAGVPVLDVLDSIEQFGESIDGQYAAIWATIEADADIARLLALLARTRGPVRLEWVRTWAPRQAFHTVTTTLAYLFRREIGGRWTFFHNSFRAFLMERTRDLVALPREAELFAELADRCATAAADDPERPEELFYRARANDPARVLALADPHGFRDQFAAGRPVSTIRDDLSLALGAAVEVRDVDALTRILLCTAEFAQREYSTQDLTLVDAWIELGDLETALESVRAGTTLLTSRAAALRAAAALSDRGLTVEAKEIFSLAEPLEVLRGAERTGRGVDDLDLLETWMDVAPRFRPVPDLLDLVLQVRASAEHVWQLDQAEKDAAAEEETQARRNRLLQALSVSLDKLSRWDEADSVRDVLAAREASDGWWFWAQAHAWHGALEAGDEARAGTRFASLTEWLKGEGREAALGPESRVALATGYLRVRRDKESARRLVAGVNQPDPVSSSAYSDDGWRSFHPRFTLNRVLGALGDHRSLREIVPDVAPGGGERPSRWDEGDSLVTAFERGVAHLGRLAGRIWVEEPLAPSDFEAHVRPLVRLFPDCPQLVHGGYVAIRARTEFYSRIVAAAVEHGSPCLDVLRKLLEAEWTDDSRRDAWPDSLIREILVELLSVGASAEWVRDWFARVAPTFFRGEDLESDLGEGVSHARSLILIGDVVGARSTISRVLRASFGIGPKDDQLNSCLAWAVEANQLDPAGMPTRFGQIAGAVSSLEGSESQSYIAPELLKVGVAAGVDPGCALVKWAFRNDVLGWVDALVILTEGLATHAPPSATTLSTFYRTLVLPFATAVQTAPITHLAAALRTRGPDEFAALGEAIEVVALGSTRPALRAAMAGQPDDHRRDDWYAAAPDLMDAFEGLSLTLEELQQRITRVSDIEDVAQRLKPNAYSFRWERALAPFLAGASGDDLFAAAGVIPESSYSAAVLTDIADRLLNMGDGRAHSIAVTAASSSRPAGWSTRYDGGSRLRAYEVLVRSSPVPGRDLAWLALHSDLAAGEVGAMDVFREWPRIVDVLAPEASAVRIWEVVSAHVAALLEDAPPVETPDLPASTRGHERGAVLEVVTGLAAEYLDHPALAVAQGAQRFFVDRLLARDEVAEGVLLGRLEDGAAPKSGALLVLRAAQRASGVLPPSMREPLRLLQTAPSYPDRRHALELLASAFQSGGQQLAPSGPLERALPAVFNLVHPPAASPGRSLPAQDALLASAQDAADLVSALRDELDLIAGAARLQPEALYAYVAERAAAAIPDGSSEYAHDQEAELREELRRLGLQITYRRPRPRRVEQAMGEAAALLLDHGRLQDQHRPALDQIFRRADPFFLLARPSQRPAEVAPIVERAQSTYVKTDWTGGVSVAAALTGGPMSTASELVQEAKEAPGTGWIVVAEESWLRWLDWKGPTETRVGCRIEPKAWKRRGSQDTSARLDPSDVDGDHAAGHALASQVAEFSHLHADEYISRARAGYSVVVRNLTYRFETPAGKWLAFNPSLAEHLGWTADEEGLFRWRDRDGNVVAESLWWQDGFSQQRPPQFDDEVGHGWLVRVSRQGWGQVSETVGQCFDWRRVARHARDQRPQASVDWEAVP